MSRRSIRVLLTDRYTTRRAQVPPQVDLEAVALVEGGQAAEAQPATRLGERERILSLALTREVLGDVLRQLLLEADLDGLVVDQDELTDHRPDLRWESGDCWELVVRLVVHG